MEEKEVNLEDLGSKLKNLEREKLKLVRDLEQWNGEQSKLDTFERENRDLMQVCAIHTIHNSRVSVPNVIYLQPPEFSG